MPKTDARVSRGVLAGMDKAEALAYVSRLFDAAQAGAVLWGDKLLLKRFLEQCSRTGSKETQDGYRRELRHFVRWRDQNHPHLHLRELDPALVDDWVSQLREQVAAGELMPRSFNRRISCGERPLPMGVGTYAISCDRSAAQPNPPKNRNVGTKAGPNRWLSRI